MRGAGSGVRGGWAGWGGARKLEIICAQLTVALSPSTPFRWRCAKSGQNSAHAPPRDATQPSYMRLISCAGLHNVFYAPAHVHTARANQWRATLHPPAHCARSRGVCMPPCRAPSAPDMQRGAAALQGVAAERLAEAGAGESVVILRKRRCIG